MTIRATTCWLLAALVAGCAAAPAARGVPAVADFGGGEALPADPGTRRVALRNGDFENAWPDKARCADRWSCTMHNDPESYRFSLDPASPALGKQSLCIQRVKPEPWALVTQAVETAPLRGARVRLSLALRSEGVDGRGTGPWVLVQGAGGPIGHHENLKARTQGWERVAVEFTVPAAAMIVEVGATQEGGGRSCIDDVRLEVLQEGAKR